MVDLFEFGDKMAKDIMINRSNMKVLDFNTPLEEAIEFISDDELIEVTPKSIRLRKRILNTELRLKVEAQKRRGN